MVIASDKRVVFQEVSSANPFSLDICLQPFPQRETGKKVEVRVSIG